MAASDSTQIVLKSALWILTLSVISLFGWVWNAQTTLTTLTLSTNVDVKQDATLKHHWTLHSWARGAINELERKGGDSLTQWPDLNP